MKISEYRELIKGQTGNRILSVKEPQKKTKVRNANRIVTEEGTFDSALEYAFRMYLIENKVEFTEKKRIPLLQGIKNINGTFSTMNIIPDFMIEELNLAIDTKGISTDRFREKFRVLNMIHPNPPTYIFVRNKKKFLDALMFIRELKKGKFNKELHESMSYSKVFHKPKPKTYKQ